jgi:hypothetical protein
MRGLAEFKRSASGDRQVKTWDAATSREALGLKAQTAAMQSFNPDGGVAFSPDGRRIS